MELVEAEEAMGEDDRVLRGFCRGLDVSGGEWHLTHGIWRGSWRNRPLLWGQGPGFEDLGVHGVDSTR